MEAELALSKDLLQRFIELASGHLSQHIDGKKEPGMRLNSTCVVE